jgi:hypothetical protein
MLKNLSFLAPYKIKLVLIQDCTYFKCCQDRVNLIVGQCLYWEIIECPGAFNRSKEAFIHLNFNTANSSLKMYGGLYANGQSIDKQFDRNEFFHGGGWVGARAFYVRFPDQRPSIVTICNSTGRK